MVPSEPVTTKEMLVYAAVATAMACTVAVTSTFFEQRTKLRNANEFVARCLSGQPLPTDSKDSDFYCRIEVRSR